jgi:hypothetical protein
MTWDATDLPRTSPIDAGEGVLRMHRIDSGSCGFRRRLCAKSGLQLKAYVVLGELAMARRG